MAVPLKLNFQPSQRRKERRLARMSTTENTRADHFPGQTLEAYLKSSSNTNLYPSLSSLATIAPYSDCKSLDVEAGMAQALIHQGANARPKHFKNLFEECIFVFAVMMATSSTTFLQGVIVINTATIGKDLKMTAAQITWIASAIGYAPLSS